MKTTILMLSGHIRLSELPRRVIALALALVLAAFSGCASISGDAETATPAPSRPSGTTVPQHGGDLFIAMPMQIDTFDPLATSNEDLINLYTLIYDTPFRYDENGRLVNRLVESWEVSDDRRTFTFHLRDDIVFSDGTPLTSRDVQESARRALNAQQRQMDVMEAALEDAPEEIPSPEASATRAPSAGSNAANFASYGSGILNMDAPDDHTFRITLSRPGNDALQFMTFPVTKADFSESDLPVGTGPYAVTEYEEGNQMVLDVNPEWWDGTPYIERIVAKAVSGPSEKINMQQTSLIDFVTTNALNAGNYNITGKSRVIDYMTNYFDCLVPNFSRPGVSDVNVRAAISYAIDRREILSTVLLNHGVPSDLPIAPDSYVVDTRFRSSQQDLNAALELLRNSGYRYEEDGAGRVLELTLIVPDTLNGTYKKEAARAIRKQLAEVFITVIVEELPEEEYLARLNRGEFDLAYCSYYLSTAPNLAYLFARDGSGNYGHFYDREIEQAIATCDVAVMEDEIISAYTALQELLHERMPVIGLYFRMNSIICDEGLGGITGVREGTVFADIDSWYTAYTISEEPVSTETPAPDSTPSHQTEPESRPPQAPTPSVPYASSAPFPSASPQDSANLPEN